MRWLPFILMLAAAPAQATCRQALALGLDVSGSVDPWEYRLQTGGLARALLHPDVRAAFLAMPQAPVSIAVYEWSGRSAQRMVLPWTAIDSDATLAAVAGKLRATRRANMNLGTALGEAKAYGLALLDQQPGCWRHTLDLSGDGKSNNGPLPEEITPRRGVTVNGLVIGEEESPIRIGPGLGELVTYYDRFVIAGPDAFVESALGFEAFEQAMTRKLLRELATMVVSEADTARPAHQ